MKLIDLYKEWMEEGNLPKYGLCNSVPEAYGNNLRDFKPPILRDTLNDRYWGCGDGHTDLFEIAYRFTPLRQTIVLLICAMNNEL